MFCSSRCRSYMVNVQVEGISSHHTLWKLSCWIKVTVSRLMFGPTPLITLIMKIFKLPNNLWEVLLTVISNEIPCFIYLFCLELALRPREVINPFPDLPKSSFDSKYMIIILYILSDFNKMYKVTYLSLPLISLSLLTLRLPQFFMLTAMNSPSVNFYSQNTFWVEQPWKLDSAIKTARRFMFIITTV